MADLEKIQVIESKLIDLYTKINWLNYEIGEKVRLEEGYVMTAEYSDKNEKKGKLNSEINLLRAEKLALLHCYKFVLVGELISVNGTTIPNYPFTNILYSSINVNSYKEKTPIGTPIRMVPEELLYEIANQFSSVFKDGFECRSIVQTK